MTTSVMPTTYARPMPDETMPPPEPLDAPERRRAGLRFDLLALAGFGAVFSAVKLHRTAAFDLAITLRVQGRQKPGIARLMTAISWPGFPPQSRIIPPGVV